MKSEHYIRDPWVVKFIEQKDQFNSIVVVIENGFIQWFKEFPSDSHAPDSRYKGVKYEKIIDPYGREFYKMIAENKLDVRIIYEYGFKRKAYRFPINPVMKHPPEEAVLTIMLNHSTFLEAVEDVYAEKGKDKHKDLLVVFVDKTRTLINFSNMLDRLTEKDSRITATIFSNFGRNDDGDEAVLRLSSEFCRQSVKEIKDILTLLPTEVNDTVQDCRDSVETIH